MSTLDVVGRRNAKDRRATWYTVDPSGVGTVGPAGPQGPKGDTGDPGPEGPAGPQGEVGPTGPPGADGATGLAGADGAPGAEGPTGADGAAGPEGPAGPQGEIGPAGPQGDAGTKGDKGDPGDAGPAGTDGAPGATGPEGPEGPQGIQGETGPQGEQGPQGEPGTGSSWEFPVGYTLMSTVDVNPATFLGYGTWAKEAEGRLLLTAGATYGAGSTGGSAMHGHGFTQPDAHTQVLNHVHVQTVNSATTGGTSGYTPDTSTNNGVASGYSTQNPTGGVASVPHANGAVQDATQLPPYAAYYVWRRTA